jgi:hypothetical protein
MGSTILNISVLIIMFGIAVTFNIFNRLGPISTEKGMKRLGWSIMAIGFAIALSQSEPTHGDASAPSEQTRQEAPAPNR